MPRPGASLIATIVGKPERRAELEALLSGLVAPTRREVGCIDYHLHRDAANPDVFIFYENFVDQAALDAHGKTPHLQHSGTRIGELITEPVSIRRLVMLSDRPE